MTRSAAMGLAALVVALTSGCGGGDPKTSAPTPSPHPTTSKSGSTVTSTPALDSIAVLGHSGTTGYNSDPDEPDSDVGANSWATGTNPAVDSIYQRLLVTHPALKGHSTSLGVDGSDVEDLPSQVDAMLKLNPLPDVVIIQSIDNDIQCDGTDAANEQAFGQKLGAVLDTIYAKDQHAQIFFVDQWSSVQTYTDATEGLPTAVEGSVGGGPCDTLVAEGKERPAGIASEQQLVDAYFAQITQACAAHPDCWTDGGHLQDMPLTEADLTTDLEHLSVQGQAEMATFAWAALPDAIKNRP